MKRIMCIGNAHQIYVLFYYKNKQYAIKSIM